MDDSKKAAVLRGCFDNLPTLNSKVVRIFISSTFTDTYEERNMLMEEVYPKIKSYCKEKHGLEFQVIDMRWGVPEEATDDHLSSVLCLQEIYNCQKVSTGPSFVTFLNQKHGFRPLPIQIKSSEFRMLIQNLIDTGNDPSVLTKWYIEDQNAVPPVYVLQPITSIIPDYKNKTNESRNEWNITYKEISTKLRKSSQTCFDSGHMTETDKQKYFMSVTEEEIIAGLLNLQGNVSEKCLCFIRIIEDIDINDKVAPRFIDMIDGKEIDKEAQNILAELRDEKVESKIKDKNSSLSRSVVKWAPSAGIAKEHHDSYLKEFGQRFYERIIQLVDKAVTNKLKLLQDRLYTEVLQHATMAKERCSVFHGREVILDKISDYLTRKDNLPLTIYGPSGSGKTSIIAKAANKVQFVKHKDAITICRFLGTSPDSSNVYRLLCSICEQILYCTNAKSTTIPPDIDDLIRLFHKLIREYKSSKPLVILLDSLDQLSKENAAHKLHWLPKKLPDDVKIVISTYIESEDIIILLKSLFRQDNFILVPKLGEELSCKILKSWLEEKNRTLTSEQFNLIENAFTQCSLPIYVKLVFEQVLQWKSYTPVDKNSLSYTVKESIIQLFKQLEHKHGYMFVSRAFAYITASNSGLSETELEDIMSIDDTLLADVFRIHVPPTIRIPPLLLVRLRHDISSYLVDREVDDITVFYWYHRQFIEAAHDRYLSDPKFETEVHSLMADYFMGKWHDKTKPFTYTPSQMKKLKKTSSIEECDRKVSSQPLAFKFKVGNQETERYNKRRLNRLPYHLIMADRMDEAKTLCLYNYDFLLAKIKATTVQQVLQDFVFSKNDKTTLFSVFKQIQSTLTTYPKTLAVEISGHLSQLLADKKQSLEKLLVERCFKAIQSEHMPVPYQTAYKIPPNALLYKFEHEAIAFGSKLVMISKDSKHLLALTVDNDLISWDLMTGELEKEVKLYDSEEYKLNILAIDIKKDLCYLSSSYQKNVNLLFVIKMGACEVTDVITLSKTYPGVGFSDSLQYTVTEDKIFCLYIGHQIDVYDKVSGKLLYTLDPVSDKFLMIPGEKEAIIHEKGTTKFFKYNLKENKITHEFEIDDVPKDVILAPVGREIIILYRNLAVVKVFNVDQTEGEVGAHQMDIKTAGGEIVLNAGFSINESFLVLRYNSGYYLWNYKMNKMQYHFKIPNEIKPKFRVTEFNAHLTADGKLFVVAYEGFLVAYDTSTQKIANITEVNRSKTELFLMSPNGEFFVSNASRGIAISTWKTAALVVKDNQPQPVTMKTAPRYIATSRCGKIAAIRGNMGSELAVFDLIGGRIKYFVQSEIDVMKPTSSWDGKYVVVREYHSDNAVKCFDSNNGKLLHELPLSSLQVKGIATAQTKLAVYIQGDNDKETYVNLYELPSGQLAHTIHRGIPSLHDMVLCFSPNEKYILISMPYKDGDPTFAELKAYDVSSGNEIYSMEKCRVRFTDVIQNDEATFLTQHMKNGEEYTTVVDLETKMIIREGKIATNEKMKDWSASPDGRHCIGRDRQLYDVVKFEFKWKYDAEEEYRKDATQQTYPRFLFDNQTIIFPNITAGLLKIASLESPEVKFIFPVHGVPVCLEVTPLGMIIVGCDDGRVMLLHKSSEGDVVSVAGLESIANRETIRKKQKPQKTDVDKSKKSKVCTIL